MNTSRVGRMTSRPFSWLDVEAIVQLGGREERAWDACCQQDSEPSRLMRRVKTKSAFVWHGFQAYSDRRVVFSINPSPSTNRLRLQPNFNLYSGQLYGLTNHMHTTRTWTASSRFRHLPTPSTTPDRFKNPCTPIIERTTRPKS